MSRFDLDTAIATWRHLLKQRRAFLAGDLDELEEHVRDFVAARVREGMAEEAAFRRALDRIGGVDVLEAEYRKVQLTKHKRQHALRNAAFGEIIMWKNYLTTLWRSLRRHPGYSGINVVGLAIGIGACLLIALYLHHELRYDAFHPSAERIHQLVMEDSASGAYGRSLPAHVAAELEAQFADVEAGVTFVENNDVMLVEVGGERHYIEGFHAATPGFFDMFGFDALAGDLATALGRPDGLVLSRATAERLFGTAEVALGATVTTLDEEAFDVERFERDGRFAFDRRGPVTYTVRAVMADPPGPTVLSFSALAPHLDDGFRGWNISMAATYLRLREGVSTEAFGDKLAAYFSERAFYHGGGSRSPVQGRRLRTQPLTDVHLRPDVSASARTGPLQYLYLFGAAALLILLIAGVNYVNLATARAVRRAREVGVRKAIGATQRQVWGQFVLEAAAVAAVALGLGVALAALALPSFEALLGVNLTLAALWSPLGLAVLVGLWSVVAFGSGAFPAFVLARFRPVQVLKGVPLRVGGRGHLRRALVVFQFAASVVLIFATLLTQQQMDFVREARLNALDDQVLVLDNAAQAIEDNYDAFKEALLGQPAVATVTTGTPPSGGSRFVLNQPLREGGPDVVLSLILADEDYFETLGLRFAEGGGFSSPYPANVDRPIIVNQAAVAVSDLADLPTAVGALDTSFNGADVVGVVEDYHFAALYDPIGPLAIMQAQSAQPHILVRLRSGALVDGLAQVRATWTQFVPDRPLQYAFLDDEMDEAYRAELQMSRLFTAFALLAVLVAALGLFGLAAFTAEQRTKEIGVRKVLGASEAGIVALLSREFLRLVAVAFVVAAPLAWLGGRRWLEDFAYRIELGPGLVLLTGALALAIALLAVGGQAWRAARTNPADALRYE